MPSRPLNHADRQIPLADGTPSRRPSSQVIGQLIREVPGTISLGQGVVRYGPPAAGLDAVPATTVTAPGRAGLATSRIVMGLSKRYY